MSVNQFFGYRDDTYLSAGAVQNLGWCMVALGRTIRSYRLSDDRTPLDAVFNTALSCNAVAGGVLELLAEDMAGIRSIRLDRRSDRSTISADLRALADAFDMQDNGDESSANLGDRVRLSLTLAYRSASALRQITCAGSVSPEHSFIADFSDAGKRQRTRDHLGLESSLSDRLQIPLDNSDLDHE